MQPIDFSKAKQDGQGFQFKPAGERLSLKGTIAYDGNGGVTSTLVEKKPGET